MMQADILVFRDKLQDAVDAADEAVGFLDEAQEPVQKANALLLGARVRLMLSDVQGSLEKVRDSIAIFREKFDEQGEKDCLELLSQLREFDFRIDGNADFDDEVETKMLEGWQCQVLTKPKPLEP